MKNELERLISRYNSIFRIERWMEVIFLIVSLGLKFIFNVPFSEGFFIVIFALFLLPFPSSYFLKKQKNIQGANLVCFLYWVFCIGITALIVYYLGNIWWIGIVILMLPVADANALLSQKKGIILAFYASFCYALLAFLEYFGILPHQNVFYLSPDLYQDPSYVLITLIIGSIVALPYIGYLSGTSSEALRKREEELSDTYKKISEAKATLEIKVKARTKELENLTRGLEEKIQQRTKELQARVEDLEKFSKIVVGRELKMVELKEKIEELEKNNKNIK